ncbi:MAG: hypothetical protein LBU17_08225 [Treponema sp.]|nr:hypothetical protein [Treponema sp.]
MCIAIGTVYLGGTTPQPAPVLAGLEYRVEITKYTGTAATAVILAASREAIERRFGDGVF